MNKENINKQIKNIDEQLGKLIDGIEFNMLPRMKLIAIDYIDEIQTSLSIIKKEVE